MTNPNFGDDFPEMRRRFGTPKPATPVMVDHASVAAAEIINARQTTGTDALIRVGIAQAEATLALAEQQRIANIIAVTDAGLDLAVSFDDVRMGLAGEVWEGLGLA